MIKGKRIVVKVGTSTLTHDTGNFNLKRMEEIVRVLSDIQGAGNEVILVTLQLFPPVFPNSDLRKDRQNSV